MQKVTDFIILMPNISTYTNIVLINSPPKRFICLFLIKMLIFKNTLLEKSVIFPNTCSTKCLILSAEGKQY